MKYNISGLKERVCFLLFLLSGTF